MRTHIPIRGCQVGPPGSDLALSRELRIFGAHGGAGTTTLSQLLKPARDMGTLHSDTDYAYPVLNPDGDPVLVACRCTTWSAIKAGAAISALTRNGDQVKILAVVSDGWPEPPIATSWFRLLSAQVGAVVRIPFIPWLRMTNDPALITLPRPARRALHQIRAITDPEGGCHVPAHAIRRG